MLKYVAVVCFSFCLKSLHFVQLFHYANSCKPSFFTLLCLISFLVMYALDVKVTQAKFLPCNVGFWLTLYLVLSLLSTCIYISLYCVFEMQISPLLLHKELMPPSRASPALSKCPGRVPPAAAVPQPGSSTSLTHKKKSFSPRLWPSYTLQIWRKPCPLMHMWTVAIVQQAEIWTAEGRGKHLGVDMA